MIGHLSVHAIRQRRLYLLTIPTNTLQTIRKLFNWIHTIDFGPSPIEIERISVKFWLICIQVAPNHQSGSSQSVLILH
jgi:hypothetical protein